MYLLSVYTTYKLISIDFCIPREIVLPPPAQPEPVNLFIGVYECTLCAEKFEEMMDLAEHVKTHMTKLEEEEELKNAQMAAEARVQAIEREQQALRELEEGTYYLPFLFVMYCYGHAL